jgi:hypothetical protein
LLQQISDWLDRTRAGDFASVAGLLVSLLGFGFTIYAVLTTKKAAQAAERATRALREKLSTYDSISTISAAITAISEIRRLHLDGKWTLLPDRYSALRQSLIAIRGGQANLTDGQEELLQGAIQQFAELERQVDRVIVEPERVPDRVKLNRTVSSQADRLMELLTQLKKS